MSWEQLQKSNKVCRFSGVDVTYVHQSIGNSCFFFVCLWIYPGFNGKFVASFFARWEDGLHSPLLQLENRGKNMRLLGISTNKLSRMLVTLKANTFGTKHLVLKAGCP